MKFKPNLAVALIAALSLSTAAHAIDVKGTPPAGAVSIEHIQEMAEEFGATVHSVEYVFVANEDLIRVEGTDESGAPFIALLDYQTGEISAMVDPATGNILEEGEYEG
jgi:hypothetical protein